MSRSGKVPATAADVTAGGVAAAEGMPAAAARGVAATTTAGMALRQCRPSACQNHS
jgi:hypothetical protein